jgi:hypothetical protein
LTSFNQILKQNLPYPHQQVFRAIKFQISNTK